LPRRDVTNSQKRSVCTSWGITGKDLYLLHVLRKRIEYPELKRAVLEQAEAFNATVVLIEDKASGTQRIQELVEQGLHAVTRYQPLSDKIMRSRRCRGQRLSRQAKLCFAESMHAQTAMIENGFVRLPKEACWRAEYLHELTVFPGGKYDDQVDSTAQLLDWLKQAGREPGGIYQYYKESAQKAGASPKLPPLSRLLPILRRW
jgi:phage terminase large subunit-like protein